jgi:helix-turn-helix protein
MREYKRGRMEILLRIIDDLSKDYGDSIPETLVLDLARKEEVENPEEKLRFLADHLLIIYTSPTTFKKTFPSV